MTLRLINLVLFAALVLGTCGMATPLARAGGAPIYDLGGITLLVRTGDEQIDTAERYALAVLGADYDGTVHTAATDYYSNPWVRDSFAWGMLPSLLDASVASYTSTELQYWLPRQQRFGGWVTAPESGYFDETAILISAVLDAYEISGDIGLVRQAVPRLVRGWAWLQHSYVSPDRGSTYLLYANVPPHVATDWADQVARSGYATQLEALWYSATNSLSIMERLLGNRTASTQFATFASHIRSDINRMLWTTAAPYATDAAPVGGFGHYRSWLGPRDYFELDSNFLCVLYGIADSSQARSITGFVRQHQTYLLGLNTSYGVPAKVLYGDYAPADYAGRHERLGPGKYQNGYWPIVGSLAAMAFATVGDTAESRAILAQIGAAFVRERDVREWYTQDGDGSGAPAFQWAARMFVTALYSAYLGIQPYTVDRGERLTAGIQLRAPDGGGSADIAFHGRTLHVSVDRSGSSPYVALNGRILPGTQVPGALLCAGCTLESRWGSPA